jgi:hypothetical protein
MLVSPPSQRHPPFRARGIFIRCLNRQRRNKTGGRHRRAVTTKGTAGDAQSAVIKQSHVHYALEIRQGRGGQGGP